MTVTALTGASLTDDAAMATLPLALQFVGTMAATIPASLLMGRVGRRSGFSIGQTIGVVFALLSAYAVYQGYFWLFAVGSAGLGVHNAFWQYLRFAASEAVSRPKRARAISYVLAGGVVAAVAGPWLATHSRDLMNPVLFAGSYAVLAGLCAATILLLQTVRFRSPEFAESAPGGRPLMEIVLTPIFITAVLSSALGYGVMVLVMTATPLAMVGHGFHFSDAAFVIQWHVLGMFVPSFFTGKLIDRFGVTAIITVGVFLNLGAMILNLSGVTLENFWIALVLLGTGWNFMYIGGTTLLTESYRPEERAKVQGPQRLPGFCNRLRLQLFLRRFVFSVRLEYGQLGHGRAHGSGASIRGKIETAAGRISDKLALNFPRPRSLSPRSGMEPWAGAPWTGLPAAGD